MRRDRSSGPRSSGPLPRPRGRVRERADLARADARRPLSLTLPPRTGGGDRKGLGSPCAIVLAALAVLTPNSGCRREASAEGPEHTESAGAGAPKRVRCAPLEARTVRAQVVLHGTVAPLPDRDAQIAPQVAGRIVEVLVREGDRVTRGQPLARIEDAALADQAKQAGAQVTKAAAETNLARTTRDRVARVVDRGIAARQELDDAQARLATAQAGETEARAAAGIASRQLERATVRSPLGGVVLKLFRKTGELVDGTPATPVLEVGDPTHLELVATATAADLVRVHARDPAAVSLPALPDLAVRGTVAAVSPAVDRATGLGSIRITLDTSTGTLPPVGVTGVAHIETGGAHLATLAPAAALRAALGDEAEIVVCGTDRRARVVRVHRGTALGALVEIRAPGGESDAGTSTLSAGVRVAVEPVLGLADGDALEPAP
jgi:membrane fusion protein, multidrug efflux system